MSMVLKCTYIDGEWASDNGFRWFTVDTLPEEWRSESETKD